MNATATDRMQRIITVELSEDEAKAIKVIMHSELKWNTRDQRHFGWSYAVPLDFLRTLDEALAS